MGVNEKPQPETGGELEEDTAKRHTGNLADSKHPVPLFLSGRPDGRKGDAQDEKDETSE